MPKRLARLLPLTLLAAVAIVALVATLWDGGEGRHSAVAKPLVDPNGKPGPIPRRPHLILIILDEFPTESLLGPDGRIDPVRYPNFASLAEHAHWFPNAWSAYDSTPKAVPLILDGRRIFKGMAADRRHHPRTLFDALGRRGWRIRASEEATALCPRRYCRNARSRRPSILRNLKGGRVSRLQRFFGSVRPGRPTFWMKHALFPHVPWMYLPSGRRYRNGPKDPVPGMSGPAGFHDRFLTQHNYQRYLLQVGFVDRELGKLLRRLVRQRMFDQTMIVVTADHGYAWKVGVKDRRKVTPGNVDEITPVPLFIKAPGQRRGKINRSLVSTLDIAPTIADVLNVRLGYRAAGRSAFSRRVRRRSVVRLPTRDFSRIVRISGRRWRAKRRRVLRRKLALFGFGPIGMFNRIGPNRGLVGRPLSDLRVLPPARVRVKLVAGTRLRRVRRSSGLIPVHVAGRVRGGRRRAKRNLVVAVNGRIEASGRSFYVKGDRREWFALMLPEAVLREGRNSVSVYQVGRGNVLRTLGGV